MAPLPTNGTGRIYFDYVTSNVTGLARAHTLQWRFGGDPTATYLDSLQSKFLSFLNALASSRLRPGWKVTGVRFSSAGNNFSVPVAVLPALASFVGNNATATWPLPQESLELTWQGRSPLTGRRVDFSLYGFATQAINALRDNSSVPFVLNTVAVLNADTPPLLTAIDGTRATWYPYVNYNYNSYWEGELRA